MWSGNNNTLALRVGIVLVGLLSVITGPYYIPFVAIFMLTLRWAAWETLIIALLLDFIWTPAGFLHSIPIAALFALILLWLFEPLRHRFLIR